MRVFGLLCLVLISTPNLEAQKLSQPTQTADACETNEDYAIPAVNEALQLLKRGVVDLAVERMYIRPLSTLGDRVSIAALKIYSADEILQTENAQAYLTVVRNAFSSRSSVVAKPDQIPKVTSFVLNYLKEKEISNAGIEKRISYLEQCVKDFSCSSQSEYDFFHKP